MQALHWKSMSSCPVIGGKFLIARAVSEGNLESRARKLFGQARHWHGIFFGCLALSTPNKQCAWRQQVAATAA